MSTPKSSPTTRPGADKPADSRRIVSEGDARRPATPADKSLTTPTSSPNTDKKLAMEGTNPFMSTDAGSTPGPYGHPPKREVYDTPPYTDSSAGDRSLTTPSTVPGSNSSMEIFLGPQPLSFVHHRQRLLVEDFDSSRSASGVAPKVASATVGVRNLVLSNADATAQPVVSKWRKDQLKKFKHSRPVAGTRERPLPILHGPLSLPYARNPSGVDATVADQNAHMSHVFGLRVADTADGKKSTVPRTRIPSDSTTRTVSGGSSLMSLEGQSDYPSSISSFGSMKRPQVIRDVNQIIGIKKDIQNPDLLLPPNEVSYLIPGEADMQAPPHKPGRDLRAQLGLGKPLPTIHDYTQGFIPAHSDYAIHTSSAAAWSTGEQHQYHHTVNDYATVALVDPITNTLYNVKVPKVAQAGATGGLACEIVPAGMKPPSAYQSVSSKADTSANWRARNAVPSSHSPAPLPPPPPSLVGSPAPPSFTGGSEVLTVENLYEKFGADKGKADANASKPKKTDKQGRSKTLGDSTSRQVNIQTDEATAPKASKKKLRPAHSKHRSVSAPALNPKGTPGAGRHLRPADAPTEDE